MIRSGRVDILVDSGAGAKLVATLGKGDFFGEAALLTGAPRNATVVAKEDLEVYSLGNDDFQAVHPGQRHLRGRTSQGAVRSAVNSQFTHSSVGGSPFRQESRVGQA